MPIAQYSLLKAHPVAGKLVSGSSAHYLITVNARDAAGQPFTAALNIQSVDGSQVLYAIFTAFQPPSLAALEALPVGLHTVPSVPGGMALDYVRDQVNGKPIITRQQMTLLPVATSASRFLMPFAEQSSDALDERAHALENAAVQLLTQAIADPASTVYVFGSAFADKGVTDGIHDIHMNQGNPKSNHGGDNGVWQDGAIFFDLPSQGSWTALFIAFQTESWQTDASGNPLS